MKKESDQTKLERATRFAKLTLNDGSNVKLVDGNLSLENFKGYMENQDIPLAIMVQAIGDVSRSVGKVPIIDWEYIVDLESTGDKKDISNKRGKNLLLKKLAQMGLPVEKIQLSPKRFVLKVGKVNLITTSKSGIDKGKKEDTKDGRQAIHFGYGVGDSDPMSVNVAVVHFNQDDVDKARFFVIDSREAAESYEYLTELGKNDTIPGFACTKEDENNFEVITKKLK